MITVMPKGEIKYVLPYIGVSNLSCIMCSHYIRAFNEVAQPKKSLLKVLTGRLTLGGSGLVFLADQMEKLRPAFSRQIRQQLPSDFEQHVAI